LWTVSVHEASNGTAGIAIQKPTSRACKSATGTEWEYVVWDMHPLGFSRKLEKVEIRKIETHQIVAFV
jgi:hypothetical protein